MGQQRVALTYGPRLARVVTLKNGEGIHMMSKAIETRRFETPDQVLDMKTRGRISIIKMADGTTGMIARK